MGEKLRYDADGRLVQSLVRGGSYSTDGTVGNLEYTYDLRGKRLSVGSDRGDVTLDYTGLGMLARAYGSMGPNTTGLVDEFYDPLRRLTRVFSRRPEP